MRQAEEKATQAGITDESLPREGCLTWKMAADRHLNYAWGVTCKHAAQKAGLRRYGKTARWAPQRKAPCRITAIAACGLIYTTPLGPVKLDDLKDQFEKYLSAAGINGGTIPSDTEVKVASRLKIFDASTHIDLGFAYAHQDINGRPRYASFQNRKFIL